MLKTRNCQERAGATQTSFRLRVRYLLQQGLDLGEVVPALLEFQPHLEHVFAHPRPRWDATLRPNREANRNARRVAARWRGVAR